MDHGADLRSSRTPRGTLKDTARRQLDIAQHLTNKINVTEQCLHFHICWNILNRRTTHEYNPYVKNCIGCINIHISILYVWVLQCQCQQTGCLLKPVLLVAILQSVVFYAKNPEDMRAPATKWRLQYSIRGSNRRRSVLISFTRRSPTSLGASTCMLAALFFNTRIKQNKNWS